MLKKIIIILILLCPLALATNQTNCNISIDLIINKQIYQNEEQIEYINHLSNEDIEFTIEYGIEDLFGNTIKKTTNTSNANPKHFTPKTESSIKNIIIKNKLYTKCNNTNKKTSNQKLIAILNPLPEEQSIKLKTSKEKYQFGDTVNIDLEVYTGNSTLKEHIYLIQEEEIVKAKIELDAKYKEYKLQIPLAIPNNCKNKLNEGKYELKIKEQTITIEVENQTNCPIKTEKVYINQTIEPKKSSYQITPTKTSENNIKPKSDQLTSATVYQSSSEKSTDYIKYIILGSLGIIILIILKNGIYNKSDNRSGRQTDRTRYQSSTQYFRPYQQRKRFESSKKPYRRTKTNERVFQRVHRNRNGNRKFS